MVWDQQLWNTEHPANHSISPKNGVALASSPKESDYSCCHSTVQRITALAADTKAFKIKNFGELNRIQMLKKCERTDNYYTYTACFMTLDFSSRYSEIFAPITAPVGVNIISRYFPKRLELSLMAVQAFPNASTRGFTWRIFSRKARLLALTEQIQIRRII